MAELEQEFNINDYINDRNIETQKSRKDKKQKTEPENKPKRKIGKYILRFFLVLFAILLILVLTQIPKLMQIYEIFDSTSFDSTSSKRDDAKGILVIGTDLTSGEDNLNGFADSITYFGLNTTSRKSASVPVYRDTRVEVTCENNQLDNINRITKKHNISCFAETTSKFLNLPVDYYVSITIDGVATVVDKIGGITITPTETFSSKYGRDEQTHYFVAGQTQKMDGATTVAFLRDRQHGNGDRRANRQLLAIQAVKKACDNDLLKCYNDVLPNVSKMMRTNIPVDKITMLSAIGDSSYNTKAFPVIAGDDKEFPLPMGWTRIAKPEDLKTKTDYFRENIFA